MDQRETEPRPHILQLGDASDLTQLTQQRGRALFRGQSEVGRSAHVIVYSDGTTAGDATAQAILQSAEADYQATQAWFGGIDLPPGQDGDDQSVPRTAPPVQVLIDPQAGGAYHFGCDATDVYVEPDPQLASGLFVAELVEIFEAALNTGWSCGQTNGEGLSRVLAAERNPNLGSLLVQTEQAWWADGHADFVTDNSADDTNQDANGCATLFLYYLHSQLGYEWGRIVAAGGSSLGETYQRLSGQDAAAGFAAFVAQLATLDVGGFLNVPASGNPYPLGAPAAPATPQPEAPQGEPAPAGVAAESASYEDAMPYDGASESAAGVVIGETTMPDMTPPDMAASGFGADVVERGEAVPSAPDGTGVDIGVAAPVAPRIYEVYETEVATIYPEGMPPAPAAATDTAMPARDAGMEDTWPRPAVSPAPAAPTSAAAMSDSITDPAIPAVPAGRTAVASNPTPARVAQSLPEMEAPYLPAPAPTSDGVETMIGVVVVLIILVLLVLISVLFYGGVIRL